ncbi:UDP-N-acetylmuramoyl-tripeptide--D-alanyl-D-alanine ligase [Sporosarcina highlanderae]|uniref:UDP-N-acetylmuramoyl-tripeptide--D-alanyl-D-alanine ligase n=1 Tax=Sporosarcina highlanderae TaxID=3035916 RepID=A0ABT8JMG3_9BACL|nr:UDP-N-acetylmuramoyl-tripeptide--D-alanyl-D-alanine ligase [Sporosarcina highlanderae]MDN4606336.1 UDP-N-acetylmuramoyl-tripeptide--D-alanyl-D-alanine ligase [Sporosarcina highlanderae]
MKRQLTELTGWLKAEGQNMEGAIVTGASIDTRTLEKGDLFIPFRGELVNGHQYVRQAFEKGAAASLWLKDEPGAPTDLPLIFVDDSEIALQQLARAYRNELTCKFIGVTGSNGKTSTKDLITSVLTPYFKVKKTEGNFNNQLGLPLTILSLEEDTDIAVLEMGMSGFGEISFLSELAKPHYAVISNIGEAHMQDLGSREGIAKAKFEIIDGLQEDGKLFFDGDEPLLQTLVKSHPSLQSVTFGYTRALDLSIIDMESGDEGSDFTVAGEVEGSFTIPVFGAHQVKNSLAAILIANELGLSQEQIRTSLQKASLTDMRMQPVISKCGALFINDAFNAAPTSMKAALAFLQETKLRPEKWAVLGDMLELGDNERTYHESIAHQLTKIPLKGILLFGPRMKWLYDELKKTGNESKIIWSEDNYDPLIQELVKSTDKDSIILLKGSRGMALEKIMNGVIDA